MNPLDSLQQDWRMYYNNAWMLHRAYGPVHVTVMDERLYCYRYPNDMMEGEPECIQAKDLECWWPRSGSYNTPSGAVYIARMCSRSMRKSAHPSEHYAVKWGTVGHYGMSNIMLQLRKGHAFVDVAFARRVMAESMAKSVAVAPDLILSNTAEGMLVVFKGIRSGIMATDTEFVPDFRDSALSRRVVSRLTEEGII